VASVTFWTRLEPRSRAGKRGSGETAPDPLARGLQAQVRDPLWMLARQWQVGEFAGEDAGSAIAAEVRLRTVPLTSYRPSLSGSGTALGTEPLETRVEREAADLGLRAAVQLGLRAEQLLRDAGLEATIADFRAAYPIAATPPEDEIPNAAAQRFRIVAAGRATDGGALYTAAKAAAPGLPAAPTFADATIAARAQAVLDAFIAYRDSLYSEPAEATPWGAEQLLYRFSVGSESATATATLDAPDFGGGHLDWYSFSSGSGALASPSATETRVRRTFLPNALTFRGMPNARWWDFEDATTDWGDLDAEKVDLAKLLVMEFALLYSDDWSQLPVELMTGTLAQIESLAVENTFGERTTIPAASSVATRGGRWSMFKITSGDSVRDDLLVVPTLVAVQDGAPLEEVVFLRDDMAAMAWGVEQKLQGPLDAGIDGYESYRRRLRDEPAPETPEREAGGPEIRYLVGTTVPDNWIPLVPVNAAARDLVLRRGLMQRPTDGGLVDVPARGRILEPEHPFYVNDESVPQAGARVTRYFRRARWSDGSTHLWLARRSRPGRGPGWSGLAFDVVERLAEPTTTG